MSTYCAIHVKAENRDKVIPYFEGYLAQTHRGRTIMTSKAETLGKFYGEGFLNSEDVTPTRFMLFSEQAGWFTVHYNSFARLKELAMEISAELSTVVIRVIAQSCSSCYYLSIFDAGRHLRTLEFADGSWIKQEGALLPFESEPLGINVAEGDEEPYYVFENDSVCAYCKHFGLDLWTHKWMKDPQPEFSLIQALPTPAHALPRDD